MQKAKKRRLGVVLSLMLVVSLCSQNTGGVVFAAKRKPSLSKKRIVLKVGKSKKLKVKRISKKTKVKWKSRNRKIASVSKRGKVTAKKAGKTTITCTFKYKGRKYTKKCKVVVKRNVKKATVSPAVTSHSNATDSSSAKPTPTEPSSVQTAPTDTPGNPSTPTPTGTSGGAPTPTGTGSDISPTLPTPTGTSAGTPTGTPTATPSATPVLTPTPEPELVTTVACSAMVTGGSYAGSISNPFSGVALYGNGDYCKTNITLPKGNQIYEIRITGASSKAGTNAGVSLYIDEAKKGSVKFSEASAETKTIRVEWAEEAGSKEFKLLLEDDNGTNDTYIQNIEVWCLGDIPEPPAAPVPAKTGAAITGNYRNMFCELGKSEAEVTAKVNSAWEKLFYGTEEECIYYPVGEDMAYIYTADTNDVRSEGMSYGMMICVQMDKQEEFDKLWKWAKTYMYHESGEYKGYFAWKCSTSGSKMDNTPASDGEEYFATSLLFASARWGDGDGIYNYNEQAQAILDAMLHQSDDGQGVNMFDSTHKMPVFCPIGNSATHTDPSYHLPAFYEVWAEVAEKDNDFWSEAAASSREYFKKATNEETGLGPDYSEFDGTPKNDGNHGDYRFDAWRIAANIACDYAWWAKDDWAITHANTIQAFFTSQGVDSYGNQWSLAGKELETDHSPGMVAMNAVASLAASDSQTWAFLEDLWNISPTTGTYRYYDGCLYMMGLLHCSGNFRAYFPGGTQAGNHSSLSVTTAEFDKAEGKQADVITAVTWNGNTLSQITNGSAVLAAGTDYTVNENQVRIASSYLSEQDVGTTTLTFVFSAGRKAKLSINISNSDTGQTGGTTSAYEKITAANYAGGSGITVSDGAVVFSSSASYVKYTVDFGAVVAKRVTIHVKDGGNGGTVKVFYGEPESGTKCADIYNLGNGVWTETSNTTWPTPPTGEVTIYLQCSNAGTEIDWIQFSN